MEILGTGNRMAQMNLYIRNTNRNTNSDFISSIELANAEKTTGVAQSAPKEDTMEATSRIKVGTFYGMEQNKSDESALIKGSYFNFKQWDMAVVKADNATSTLENIDSSKFKEVETKNYKFVPEPGLGKGAIRIYVNGEKAGVYLAEDLKVRVDEKTGTRVLIGDMNELGSDWYDAIPVNAELKKGLAEAIGEEHVPEVPLEGYYIGTHAESGIRYVMRPGEEGKGGKVLLCDASDEAKYKALAQEYMTRYPNLIKDEWEGLFYASNEIRGMSSRAASGIVNTHYDCISYSDNNDYTKNWSAKIDNETWNLILDWFNKNKLDSKAASSFNYWDRIFSAIGGSYEMIW